MEASRGAGRADSPLSPLVVLAAGRSSRLGGPKGLVRLPDGRVWIAAQLRAYAVAGGARALIVVRPELAGEYQVAVRGLSAEVVANPRADELGPFSSLQLGLGRMSGPAFVSPVDVPFAGPEVWRALEAALAAGAEAAVPVSEGRGGHPVQLSARACERVSALDPASPEARLDLLLRAWGAKVARVPVNDSAVVGNLNRPEDWAAFRECVQDRR